MLKPKTQIERLQQVFKALPATERGQLLAFAEFLYDRSGAAEAVASVPSAPVEIDRPEQETVVAAIKRLTATYPMIDVDALFHESSSLMTQHLMHGRAADEVIDELEALFATKYEDWSGQQT